MKVAIVGGGPGGLMAAYHLINKTKEKLNISIFEATYRLGGKILTKQFQTLPAIYEAGVAELYHLQGTDDPLRDLLQNLNFTFIPMSGDASIFENKIIPNIDSLKEIIGISCWKEVKKFIEEGKEYRKPEDFATGGWPADNKHPWAKKKLYEVFASLKDENAKRFLEIIMKSDLATEPSIVNGTYGFDNYLVDDPDYCQIYTIEGGISGLVEALHQYIDPNVTIHLNAPVKHISKLEDNKYKIISQDGSSSQEEEFDAVLICLPQQWKNSIDYGLDLRIAISKHFAHYNYPAHYLRVACLFKKPFWKEFVGDGSYFRLDAFGGCCVYDESSRYPMEPYGSLNWLLGGTNAEAIANLEDDFIISRALDSLPPEMAKQAKELAIEAYVHRWIGTVNGQPGGQPVHDIKEKHLPDPINHPNLILVGDYLFDSTLNGLLDSADLATSMLLKQLDKLKPEYQKNPSDVCKRKYPVSRKVKTCLRKRR